MQEAKNRGLFIVLEGLDRSGKSTQCKKLTQRLIKESKDAININFPDRTTPLGQQIDLYLRGQKSLSDQAIHLLFSANRWEKAQEIKEKVNSGQFIVCDRYAFSGVAFTAAKGLDLDWCKGCDVGLPEPDLVFFLKASEGVAERRGGFGDEVYEKTDFQKKVGNVFQQLQKEESWIEINADQGMEEITQQLYQHVEQHIQTKQQQPIGQLWKKQQ